MHIADLRKKKATHSQKRHDEASSGDAEIGNMGELPGCKEL